MGAASLRDEVRAAPAAALAAHRAALREGPLPRNVPYLGMGSSYYAALSVERCGAPIRSLPASEYDAYGPPAAGDVAVLLSQSGRSSETLWCAEQLPEYVAITADPRSPLARNSRRPARLLHSGPEHYSSSKSYLATLALLYTGLDLHPQKALAALADRWQELEAQAAELAERLAPGLPRARGLYLLGSGPNWGTAQQGALILTETLKLPWQAATTASYDHGLKEACAGALILSCDTVGRQASRSRALQQNVTAAGGAYHLLPTWHDEEPLTVFALSALLCLLAAELSERLGTSEPFVLGEKVTQVDQRLR